MTWVLKRDGSFEHPKHKLKQMGEKIFTILRSNICAFLNLRGNSRYGWWHLPCSINPVISSDLHEFGTHIPISSFGCIG